jgi:hypothetical protein
LLVACCVLRAACCWPLRVCVFAIPRTCSLQPLMVMDSKSAASGRRRAPDPGAETCGWRPRRDLQGGIRSASPMRPETCTRHQHPASSSLGPFLAHALGLPPPTVRASRAQGMPCGSRFQGRLGTICFYTKTRTTTPGRRRVETVGQCREAR